MWGEILELATHDDLWHCTIFMQSIFPFNHIEDDIYLLTAIYVVSYTMRWSSWDKQQICPIDFDVNQEQF